MTKSKIENIREVLIYAPLGVFGFIKDNAPIVFSIFVSRGKTDVGATSTNTQSSSDTENVIQDDSLIGKTKPLIKSRIGDMTSDITKSKEILFSSIGALGFVKNNASIFNSTFSQQGKNKVEETTKVAKEKLRKPNTKDEDVESGLQSEEDFESSSSEVSIADKAISCAVSASETVIATAFSTTQSVFSKFKNLVR